MTTPKQHADSQTEEIRLKAELNRLRGQEADAELWSKVTLVAGLVLMAIALISTL